MMKAVIDRIEGDWAVLVVKGSEERFNVPRGSLPKKSEEGSWLQVEIENGDVRSAILDEEETARTKKRIAEKLERLRRGEHRTK